MGSDRLYQFQVKLIRDKETGQVVAKIPALGIADYGMDSQTAIQRLKRMAVFHLESLEQEGKPIPQEKQTGEGLYLRVKVAVLAA
jgi:predicted RNase H-like HicB family nuclease